MELTAEQTRAVYEDKKNILVSAGAGSGKTSVLTTRVIRKLKDHINIDELLILTFTNAAALEMKERIRKRIKKEPELKNQLDYLDSAYIGTFDSFASTVVKKYNYLLNISKDFKIIDSNLLNYQKEEILNNILDEEYKSKNSILFNLISSYCDKDDENIRKYILNLDNKLNLLIDKDKYINEYIDNYFKEEKINNDIKLYVERIFAIVEEIKTNLDNFSSISSAKNIEKLNDYLLPIFNVKTYDDLVKIDLGRFPTLTNLEAEAIYKENIQSLLGKLKDYLIYSSEEEIKKTILSTFDYISFIVDIEKRLAKEIDEYKYANNLFEFNDIAKLAIKVVKDNDFVKDELRNSFKEIMIDEYQDTSDLQEEFINLIANNNVYMVGDIKQSIYRFRNANPDLFKAKYNDYANNQNGLKIDLTSNFRSRKEVIDDINLVFINLMTDINYAEQQMVYGNTTYDTYQDDNLNNNLEILNYNFDKDVKYKDNVVEAFIIAKDIKNKIENGIKVYDKDAEQFRESTYQDYAILIDRASSFDMYKKIFEYFKLPLEIWNDEKISDSHSFMLLKNILYLIVKIKDNEFDRDFKYLMTSILRSPLMEVNDQEIFKLFLDDSFKETSIFKKCLELGAYLDNHSIKELTLKVIDEFDFYHHMMKIGNVSSSLAKIEFFINNSNTFADIGYSVKDFIGFLNDVLDEDNDIRIGRLKTNSNTIKLMTIHASKGLEYPICYYAGLATKTNRQDLNDRFLFDKDLGIIVPYDIDGIGPTIYKSFYKEKYIAEEIAERIRLFYVALTRAREKMILVTKNLDNKIKEDMTSFNDFLSYIYPKIENKIKEVDLESLELTRNYNLIKDSNFKDHLKPSNVVIAVNELSIDNSMLEESHYSKHSMALIDEDTKKKMEFGLKVHECLELLDFNNPNYNNIEPFIKNKIELMLKQDIFKYLSKAKIYKEYEFIDEDNNSISHGIIDLMLVYDDHIDIIDYKLKNIDDEAYIKQLNGYKKYIENKLNKDTNIYLYSIMDNKIEKI